MAQASTSLTIDRLRDGIRGARPGGRVDADRARRLLLAWFDTAVRAGLDARALARAMRDGVAAVQIARSLDAGAARPAGMACAAGCAFCCILDGPDGGTITEAEARDLHAALRPLAGRPDGRDWHPAACPALDPDTRTCRAYDARPTLCRAYVSTDAQACETNAGGGAADGAGLLGFQLDYLAVLALSRAALNGVAPLRTYALTRVAAAAVDRVDVDGALDAARHVPRVLADACKGLTSVAAARD